MTPPVSIMVNKYLKSRSFSLSLSLSLSRFFSLSLSFSFRSDYVELDFKEISYLVYPIFDTQRKHLNFYHLKYFAGGSTDVEVKEIFRTIT